MFASAEDLMAGVDAVTITLPDNLLALDTDAASPKRVELRPLTIRDVQLIARAAKEDEVLTSVLMIQQSMQMPKLEQKDIAAMSGGLVSFITKKINEISGLYSSDAQLRELSESPIGQAFFVLAREFNWTPEQVRELTLGQILGYLEMLNNRGAER